MVSGSQTRHLHSLGIVLSSGLGPTTGELGKVDKDKWFTYNPYAEWYLNSLRIAGSPTQKHHAETYGRNFDCNPHCVRSTLPNGRRWHVDEVFITACVA
jgi:hypothetical protein